jgi:hypothetical protein
MAADQMAERPASAYTVAMNPRELAEIDAKPIALDWVASAQAALDSPDAPLTQSALATNFAFARLDRSEHESHRVWIAAAYVQIRSVLDRSHVLFAGVSEKEARALFGSGIPPAYAIGGDRVYFTPEFKRWDPVTKRGYGPKCRAAMLIHESVHIFDGRSGEPEIHLSEWDPRFDHMTPEQQLHNASAYASFAAQVHHRALSWTREERYGAGRPAE